ncbi:MAG: ATP-binding protein [Acidobacteriota bacterium]
MARTKSADGRPSPPGLRLEHRLRLYLLALHFALALALVEALRDRPLLLFAAEIGFVVSAVLGWRLISGLFVPLRLIETGTDLIDEGDFTSTFVPVGQPEMDRLIEVYNRMIAALREERLHGREQEDFLGRLIEASPAGVVLCDFEGAVMRINPAAARLLGEVDAGAALVELPRPWSALADLELENPRVLSLHDGRRIRCRAGELRDRGFRRRFLVLEEMTEELRRSEKAAYEKLIRMVSHEVNNSVGAVTSLLGSLGHYRGQLTADDQADYGAALSIGSGRLDRLRAFIDAFAELVRLPAPDRRPLDLDALVDDLVTLYRPGLAERSIQLERRLGNGMRPPISADRQQLEQALINVVENAADAIGDRGAIRVSTSTENGVAVLTIDDDGPGLDVSAAAELFTPFFTTKPEGQGLGLTLVKEVLTRHGFPFSLENRPGGRGCTFRVRFDAPSDGGSGGRDLPADSVVPAD